MRISIPQSFVATLVLIMTAAWPTAATAQSSGAPAEDNQRRELDETMKPLEPGEFR